MSIYGFSELTCTRLYPKYLEFRHQVFNEILKYHQTGNPVFHFKAFDVDGPASPDSLSIEKSFEVEYDNYDIPKTLHLAFLDDTRILGCLRFLPTDGPYMIKDNIERGIWKDVELLVDKLPMQSDVYEASRIAVAPDLRSDARVRDNILDNLVYANVELGARLGIKKMVGIMYDRVWKSVYMKRGVPITYISKPFNVDDGPPIIIGEIDTSEKALEQLQIRFARELAEKIITPPDIESGTWLMHYYHVNKTLPASRPLQVPADETSYVLSN